MKAVHNALLVGAGHNIGLDNTTKVLLVEDLRLPIHLALGRYEAATPEELDELITDLTHERDRRVS